MYNIKLFWNSSPSKIIAQNLKGQSILSNSVSEIYTQQININFYWDSEPAQIIEKQLKGKPILTFDFGIFKAEQGGANNPLELISSDAGNNLNVGSDGKLYIDDDSDDDTNYLLSYILAKE